MIAIAKRFIYSPRAYHSLIDKMIEYGEPSYPRGLRTVELINATLILRNPLDRIVPDRGRRTNVAFGIAEWYSIMFGIDKVDFFSRFIENYGDYSTDGNVLDGAYGTRIHYYLRNSRGAPVEYLNQIDCIIEKLKTDPDSRQAVMSIYSADDLTVGIGGKNTPCTLTLQFLVRDSQLHLIVNMRSSDVFKGLTYDVMVFTFIQELIARRLDLPIGQYLHNAASLHMYDSDFPLVDRLTRQRWPQLMETMPLLDQSDINAWFYLIRDGSGLDKPEDEWFATIDEWKANDRHWYLANLSNVMKAFVERKRNHKLSERAYLAISDMTLKYVLRPWLVRAGVLGER